MDHDKAFSKTKDLSQSGLNELCEGLEESNKIFKEQNQLLEKLKIEANQIKSSYQQGSKPPSLTFKKSNSKQINQLIGKQK